MELVCGTHFTVENVGQYGPTVQEGPTTAVQITSTAVALLDWVTHTRSLDLLLGCHMIYLLDIRCIWPRLDVFWQKGASDSSSRRATKTPARYIEGTLPYFETPLEADGRP